MRCSLRDHRFLALFPPYHEMAPVAHPSEFPSSPYPPRGFGLVWNLALGDWDAGFRAVAKRPPGVALVMVLPPTGELTDIDPRLELMAGCRPHSVLPYLEELTTEELVPCLRRFPSDLALEVSDYLSWRGMHVDTDTRRLIRRTLALSEELRTVSGLARSLYLSRRALGRRFTSRGLPAPSHWLHFGRILRASLRLQHPSSTLHAISCDLGYPDGFALSNQMVRLTGLRPSLMRECFGWEWIVESWLLQEAKRGNIASELGRSLFPREEGCSLRGPGTLRATGTTPGEGLSVAERPFPNRSGPKPH